MAKRGRPRSKPASQDLLDRLGYYRRMLFRDNQRLMADSLGLSPSYLSKVFTGTQPPSHAFLESLARHPMVNRDWLFREEGAPLLPPTAGTLPGAAVILPGPPTEHPDLLSGNRFQVPATLERDSVYYLTLQPTSPLVRRFPEEFRPGDRLAIETARAVLDRPDVIDGHLCAVITQPETKECVMAVVFARSGGLFAQPFDEPAPAAEPSSKGSDKAPPPTQLKRRLTLPKKKKKETAETQLDGSHQVVGLVVRLERDGPLCPVRVHDQRIRTFQAVETEEEEAANRFAEPGRPEEHIRASVGSWGDEDDREKERVPVRE